MHPSQVHCSYITDVIVILKLIIVIAGGLQNYLSSWINLGYKGNVWVPSIMADMTLLRERFTYLAPHSHNPHVPVLKSGNT